MKKSENYHFHKDCIFYPNCKEEKVEIYGKKRVRFICPALKHSQLYTPTDIHSIKWECSKFVPYQQQLAIGE